MSDEAPIPEPIRQAADSAARLVADTVGVPLDYSPETLPVADLYLKRTLSEKPREVRDSELIGVGAYFGEVIRRKLGGNWTQLDHSPPEWKMALAHCPLAFHPVGMAAETLAGCEMAEYDGAILTEDAVHEELSAMMAAAPPLPEDQYYSLAGRAEVLTMVADWLVGRQADH